MPFQRSCHYQFQKREIHKWKKICNSKNNTQLAILKDKSNENFKFLMKMCVLFSPYNFSSLWFRLYAYHHIIIITIIEFKRNINCIVMSAMSNDSLNFLSTNELYFPFFSIHEYDKTNQSCWLFEKKTFIIIIFEMRMDVMWYGEHFAS